MVQLAVAWALIACATAKQNRRHKGPQNKPVFIFCRSAIIWPSEGRIKTNNKIATNKKLHGNI